MAATKTKIVNRALTLVGARPVSNIDDDDSSEAEAILNVYDISLESILAEELWGFARKRALLTQLVETIPFNVLGEDLNIVYQQPVDAIRIFQVNDPGALWYPEEDKILSDTSNLGIIYTFLQTNTARYKPKFVEAFAHKLASDIAFQILNNKTTARAMLEEYEEITLPRARAENAQTGSTREINDNFILNARKGGPNVKEFS